MKLEDARPLNSYSTEELLKIRELFQGSKEILSYRKLCDEFLYSCDNFAYNNKHLRISDYDIRDKNSDIKRRKIATTENCDSQNDFLCVQSRTALMKWNPDEGEFCAFFYVFLKRLPTILADQAHSYSRNSKEIYKSVLNLIRRYYPDRNPEDVLQNIRYFESPIIKEAVKEAFPDKDDKRIDELAANYVSENNVKNKIFAEDYTMKDENMDLLESDFLTLSADGFSAKDEVAESWEGKEKWAPVCERIDGILNEMREKGLIREESIKKFSMIFTSHLCTVSKSITGNELKTLSDNYACITKDYQKILDFASLHDSYPNDGEIAKMLGVQKTAIANLWGKFKKFANKDEKSD